MKHPELLQGECERVRERGRDKKAESGLTRLLRKLFVPWNAGVTRAHIPGLDTRSGAGDDHRPSSLIHDRDTPPVVTRDA